MIVAASACVGCGALVRLAPTQTPLPTYTPSPPRHCCRRSHRIQRRRYVLLWFHCRPILRTQPPRHDRPTRPILRLPVAQLTHRDQRQDPPGPLRPRLSSRTASTSRFTNGKRMVNGGTKPTSGGRLASRSHTSHPTAYITHITTRAHGSATPLVSLATTGGCTSMRADSRAARRTSTEQFTSNLIASQAAPGVRLKRTRPSYSAA